jgi:plastocyanin
MPLSRFLLLAAFCAAPLAAQTTHTVTLNGVNFSPDDLTINAGDTVIWDNVSGFHNVNGEIDSYPDNPEGFTSGAVTAAPWQFSHTFTIAGDYGYHCDAHGGPGSGMFGTITVNETPAVEDDLPPGVTLSAFSPNPFREETAFTLTAATPEPIRVAVYDALGREVEVLHDGPLPAGAPVSFVWAPVTARAGAYLVRIEGATFRASRKVVRVR